MNRTSNYVEYLESLRENRPALAALRRGLGRPVGTTPEMYRYVVPWLGEDAPPWQEAAYYQLASLFASHPQDGGEGNMGASFARARSSQEDDTAIERRFTALLAAHPDDLDFYLRQAVSFLRSQEVPINWHQLYYDLMNWGHPEYGDRVRKNWANSFWGATQKTKNTDDD
ncbi:MAG: type I-E CRISPR-associated protein Cse2/CasB [Anaerolineales bacterium]|nr:type I-E CRISPR-associated protein Cse2/CasB [Anaerolineales bacterium]